VPGEIIEHDAHALGHDDVLIPLLDRARHVDVVVPATVPWAGVPRWRRAADRAYIDALRNQQDLDDARLEQDSIAGLHLSNLELAKG
jgi:hypothetical protein